MSNIAPTELQSGFSKVLEVVLQITRGQPTTQSPFHSNTIPNILVTSYIDRVVRYMKCSSEALVVTLMFMQYYAAFSTHAITDYNVHRVLITAAVIAAKSRDDEYFTNTYYAKIGGISASEMRKLETAFLEYIDWDAWVEEDGFDESVTLIRNLADPSIPADEAQQAVSFWQQRQSRAATERRDRVRATLKADNEAEVIRQQSRNSSTPCSPISPFGGGYLSPQSSSQLHLQPPQQQHLASGSSASYRDPVALPGASDASSASMSFGSGFIQHAPYMPSQHSSGTGSGNNNGGSNTGSGADTTTPSVQLRANAPSFFSSRPASIAAAVQASVTMQQQQQQAQLNPFARSHSQQQQQQQQQGRGNTPNPNNNNRTGSQNSSPSVATTVAVSPNTTQRPPGATTSVSAGRSSWASVVGTTAATSLRSPCGASDDNTQTASPPVVPQQFTSSSAANAAASSQSQQGPSGSRQASTAFAASPASGVTTPLSAGVSPGSVMGASQFPNTNAAGGQNTNSGSSQFPAQPVQQRGLTKNRFSTSSFNAAATPESNRYNIVGATNQRHYSYAFHAEGGPTAAGSPGAVGGYPAFGRAGSFTSPSSFGGGDSRTASFSHGGYGGGSGLPEGAAVFGSSSSAGVHNGATPGIRLGNSENNLSSVVSSRRESGEDASPTAGGGDATGAVAGGTASPTKVIRQRTTGRKREIPSHFVEDR